MIQERHIEWTSPAPLWDELNGPTSPEQRRIFRTPALLRFASDSFMQDFLGLMQLQPQRLGELLAAPETWSNPQAEVAPPAPVGGLRLRLAQARNSVVRRLEARQGAVRALPWNAAPQPSQKPLKLYHPAHQRYYLVAACLVCRTIGLPDRPLNTGAQERASFVLRMLRPRAGAAAVNPDPEQCDELALCNGEWVPAADPTQLQPGEEQNPLSPLTYAERDGRKRRLLCGFIPVGKRDALIGARQPSTAAVPPPALDRRQLLLKQQVLGPWKELEDLATRAAASSQYEAGLGGSDPGNGPRLAAIQKANEQIQMIAWYVLLDLSHWLEANAPAVWTAAQPGGSPGALQPAELNLYNALGALSSEGQTLRDALAHIRAFEPALEGATHIYRQGQPGWPTVAFRFVTATLGGPTGLTGTNTRQALETKLNAVLAAPPPGLPVPALAQAGALPFDSPWLTIRCVLERPNCAALSAPVVSDPTAAFQLAAFFDPDAPARPIRIGMPADTTPAGLRKFDRNTAFVLSDVLCGQISTLRKLSFVDLILAVLPFPLHKDLSVGDPTPCSETGEGFGMVCSFSLPIITICALIMLMIMVKLLDIVLFWMPFFQICLPLPKKGGS